MVIHWLVYWFKDWRTDWQCHVVTHWLACTCTCTCTYSVVNDRWGATTLQPSPSSLFCFQLLLQHHKTSTLSIQRYCSPNASSVGPFFSLLALFLVKSSWQTLMIFDTYPNHFNLSFFTVVKISSWGPMARLILSLTASLVMWSLYEMPSSLLKFLISVTCNSLGYLLSMSRFRRRTIVLR